MNRPSLSLLAFGLGALIASAQPATAAPQGGQQQQTASEFFVTVPTGSVTRMTKMSSATRQRNVRLNLSLMQNDSVNAGPVSQFSFQLFPDVTVTGSIQDIEMASAGGFIVDLNVDQDPNGHIYLSVVDQAMTATFRFNDRLFQVHHVGAGEHTISEVNELKMQTCGTPHPQAGMTVNRPVIDGPAGEILDMLVVYTDNARVSNGGTSGIVSLINLAMFETNRSYAKSDITMRVNLVHTAEVNFSETGSMQTWVNQLRSTTDGVIDQVHQMRDDYGADAVSMIVDTGGYCGIAYWVMTTTTNAASKAFNVTKDTCATGNYSFGHELGHCLGAQHDPANTSGSALYPYCYGYRTTSGTYRSVMAYAPGTRIDIWSNPAKKAPNGEVMGVANAQDNHRVLNNVDTTASTWRAHRDVGHRITTTFAGGNNFAGNMFNIRPKDDITISAIDVNSGAAVGAPIDVRVWYRAGSYVGHDTSSLGWCELGRRTGKSAGLGKASRIYLSNSKTFRSDKTYGIYVELVNFSSSTGTNLHYTNGAAETFENNHLLLTTGVGKGIGFAGATFADRRWNGRIYYRGGDGAHTLATTFTSNNGANGNMFTVKPKRALTINSFDVNLSGTGNVTVDVWMRTGSYIGFEQNASGWTHVGTDGKAVSAGIDLPTRITVGDISLSSGTTYSFYFYCASAHLMHYTTGAGTYSNGDMTITTGIGRGPGAFSGSIFTPRSWNGRIRYSVSPFSSIGLGCRGSTGKRMLQRASGTAEIDTLTKYSLSSGVPGQPVFLVFGSSTKSWAGLPLPLDLGFLGAKSCMVYQDMPITMGSFKVSASGTYSVGVRFQACSLIGVRLYSQFISLDRGANPLGITTSNGMSTVVGL